MNQFSGNETVLNIMSSYEYRDRFWIFMELMDDDLTSVIKQNHETYSENVVKYILKRIIMGLAHLHSLNVIHRDIKSDNILVNTEG